MAQQCVATAFTADPETFAGEPLVLDTWLSLGAVNLNLVTVQLWDYDILVIGGEGPGGGVVGGDGGGVVGPE